MGIYTLIEGVLRENHTSPYIFHVTALGTLPCSENVCKYIFMNHTQSRIFIYGDFKAFFITSCIRKDTRKDRSLKGFCFKSHPAQSDRANTLLDGWYISRKPSNSMLGRKKSHFLKLGQVRKNLILRSD